VRPHDGVHLAAGDGEVDALQDLPARHAGPQAPHLEERHQNRTTTSSPSTATSYTATGCVAGSVFGSPVSSEKAEPCFQHSISLVSSYTSPSLSGTSAWLQRSASA